MKTIITVADRNGKTTFQAVEPRKMSRNEINAEVSAWCTTNERKGGVKVQYVG